jgi:hypothetical protein
LRKDGVSGSLQVARAALRNRAIRATLVAFLTRLLALDREPFLEAVTGSRQAAEVAHSGVEQRMAGLEPRDAP